MNSPDLKATVIILWNRRAMETLWARCWGRSWGDLNDWQAALDEAKSLWVWQWWRRDAEFSNKAKVPVRNATLGPARACRLWSPVTSVCPTISASLQSLTGTLNSQLLTRLLYSCIGADVLWSGPNTLEMSHPTEAVEEDVVEADAYGVATVCEAFQPSREVIDVEVSSRGWNIHVC